MDVMLNIHLWLESVWWNQEHVGNDNEKGRRAARVISSNIAAVCLWFGIGGGGRKSRDSLASTLARIYSPHTQQDEV